MLQENHSGVVAENDAGLEQKVSFLSQPATYPGNIAKVEAKETHLSWVFLAGGVAYKLKKPVGNELFDFRTVAARLKNAKEEIRVNKRLAPNIYLGIVPLVRNNAGQLQLGGKGTVVDWLVKMKRIPDENFLDHWIKSHRQDKSIIETAAGQLAEFYIKSHPVKTDIRLQRRKIREEIVATHAELLNPVYHFSPALVEEITDTLLQFLERHYLIFESRIANRKIIEAHGDLKPEHVCLVPECAFIDALEFSKELRTIDIAEELAFLELECEILGDALTGQQFVDCYQNAADDRIPEILITFYKCKKAFLRARQAAGHITETGYQDDPKWLSKANVYLLMAHQYAQKLAS